MEPRNKRALPQNVPRSLLLGHVTVTVNESRPRPGLARPCGCAQRDFAAAKNHRKVILAFVASANAHTLRALLSMPALDSAHTHTQRAREGGQLRLCGEERCERRDEVRQAQQKRNCFGSPATETHWPISMFCLAQSAAPRAHLEAVTTGNPWADFHPYPLTNALHRGGPRPSVVSIIRLYNG